MHAYFFNENRPKQQTCVTQSCIDKFKVKECRLYSIKHRKEIMIFHDLLGPFHGQTGLLKLKSVQFVLIL